jgi:2-oxoglutarate dehydrogenase E1 component
MNHIEQFYGPNAGYVLELYERYQRDPQSVDEATRAIFANWPADGAQPQLVAPAPAATNTATPAADGHHANTASDGAAPTHAATPDTGSPLDVTHTIAAARLIRYIREVGHKDAKIDPLGSPPPGDPGLLPHIHDLTEDDIASLPASVVRGPIAEHAANALEGIKQLRQVYAGSISYETDHVHIFEERSWIRESAEDGRFFAGIDDERKIELLERLTEVEGFERFLHTTFQGQKRFSLEGCDMLVPMLDAIVRGAASSGVREVVLGMAHRGRLNVLAHILGKPYSRILAEFHHANRDYNSLPAGGQSYLGWVGDVKYHLGARRAYRESGVDELPITLAPNPSHLEFVNPVVEGRARAAQERRDVPGAPTRDKHASLPILMHGDAAFPGQGVVAETLSMSNLAGYDTGGTIHIITNNQVGFTTEPNESRSTLYASDLAKGFEVPVVHVNADDPVACLAAARMAYAYRDKFSKDFVIDLVGYRRWGHNEGDEPTFTQPAMYQQIVQHPTVRAILARQLVEAGVLTEQEVEAMQARVQARLQQAREQAEGNPQYDAPPPPPPPGIARRTETAVDADALRALNEALLQRPADFTVNSKLARTLDRRRSALDQPASIDWGHAEALAFASLLADGIPIRLTGQDSERGTFSHRHAVLRDAQTGARYCSLQALPQAKASFAIHNSLLSEAGVLGFEFGYSAHAPSTLVLWEAQFGDFANGAQVIIDQFIVSARKKWGQTPALVLLLPHGYEGQGPEHSSARLERFLQLCADDNIRVANCTSAAQYFHLLRRQALLLESDPRPLVLMTPKSLLRHPKAASSLEELTHGRFQRVIDDAQARERADEVTRLVLCSGKVYIDLQGSANAADASGVAVARVEELYSFPADELRAVIAGYPNLHEIVWLQEEPQNMGAWSYMEPQLRTLLPAGVTLHYVGRAPSASPAEGSPALHAIEQARIVGEALSVTPDPVAR